MIVLSKRECIICIDEITANGQWTESSCAVGEVAVPTALQGAGATSRSISVRIWRQRRRPHGELHRHHLVASTWTGHGISFGSNRRTFPPQFRPQFPIPKLSENSRVNSWRDWFITCKFQTQPTGNKHCQCGNTTFSFFAHLRQPQAQQCHGCRSSPPSCWSSQSWTSFTGVTGSRTRSSKAPQHRCGRCCHCYSTVGKCSHPYEIPSI